MTLNELNKALEMAGASPNDLALQIENLAITDKMRQMIDELFPESDRQAALSAITTELGSNLPCTGKHYGMVKCIRLTAIEVSEGSMEILGIAIAEAKADWRDLLMWLKRREDKGWKK